MKAITEKILIDRSEVPAYIPHRPPMILVDRLSAATATHAVGSLRIRPDNPFLGADGVLRAAGLIEHMAQTMALQTSYLSRQEGASEFFGFIVNVKQFRYERLPRRGERIRTRAEVIAEHGGFTTVAFETFHAEERIATARMGLMVRASGGA
jgi:predicted hotdog family 3-hydroxylacyl-ACP dehydratase